MACVHHPSSATVSILNGRGYCGKCVQGMKAAAANLDAHVTPRDCFVWYKNAAEGWQPIAGTGCAHYVAHEQGVRFGGPSGTCLLGFTYRVPALLTVKNQVTGGLSAVQVNDVWVNAARSHTGIVSKIDSPTTAGPASGPASQPANPIIWITHASSGQHALATNRFDEYFHSGGDFFR